MLALYNINIENSKTLGRDYMKKNTNDSQNVQAWDYAIGIVQVEGIRPSDDFLELVEKEKRGEMTNEDIRRVLVKKYTVVGDTVS